MEESGRNSVPLRAAGGADGLREEGAALADGVDILYYFSSKNAINVLYCKW